MGILDDYLNSSTPAAPAAAASSTAPSTGASIISQYLDSATPEPLPKDRQKVYIVKPPISDATPEQSAAINAQPGIQGTVQQPAPFPLSPAAVIPNVGRDIATNAKEGWNNFSGGMGDMVAGQPASGAKRMAVGALQGLTALPAGIAQGAVADPVTQLTGSPDIGDRAGFVAGSAIPIVPGASAVSKAIPKNAALKTLIEKIGPDNLPAVVSAMKANPRLGPADLSPPVLSMAQKLFVTEGDRAKDYLASTSASRMATAKDTVNGAFDSAMGPTVNAADKLDQLKASARKVGKEQIEPFIAANPHTDVTDLVHHIDSEIGGPAMRAIKKGEAPPLPLNDYQRELLNVRNKIRGNWPDKDQMLAYTDTVHAAQSELREKAQGLKSSAVGSERNLAGDLFKFREKIKDAVGPEYKKALGKYADEKQIDEAFHYGHDSILKNGRALENDPSFFEKWVNDPKRKPDELEAAKEGARRAINAEIQGTRSAATNPASKGVAIGQVDFNKQRLTSLLGKEEADKLLKTLDDTRLEANTHNKIVEGSQTAMRSAAEDAVSLPEKANKNPLQKYVFPAMAGAAEVANNYLSGGATIGAGLAATGAAVGAGKLGSIATHAAKLALAKERNLQLAKYSLPTQGPSRDALIKSLEAAIPGPKQSRLVRGAAALSRLVAP